MFNKLNIHESKKKLIVYIVLVLITLTVYWQVNQFDFINFDDNIYVTENSHIQSGLTLQGFLWAFGSKYFGLWNPLVWISFMLNHQIYGMNAGGYHVTNLILHIMSTLLLFWLFNRMTGAIWKSAFVAALFALHPLHVESVAWIAERKDALSAFFWILTLCMYVRYTENQTLRKYLLVLFCFVLALLSKPMVITLPLIMILLDYWPLNRFESHKGNLLLWQLKEKMPFFILSAVLVIIILYTPDKNNDANLSFISRLTNAPVAFITYLGKTFWPGNLTIFYPFPAYIPAWQVVGASLLIIFISSAAILLTKHMPCLFTGWLWYVITIAPVIGIVQIGYFAVADRYHYLPSIGIGVLLAWGTPLLFKNESMRNKVLFPAAIAFLTILMFLSWKQCAYWKNNTLLWNHALKVTNDNYMAHNNLAIDLLEKGEIQKALYHYNKAISINNFALAYYNTGLIYYRLGQYQQAITNFHQAIHVKHDYAAAYYNLGVVYHFLGQPHLAIKNYDETIRIMPEYANAYNNRAYIYLTMGNKISGCSNALKACKLGNCKTLIWANSNRLCN